MLGEVCHVHPLVVVHAPASCGRGLEGDGRSILEVMRRRRKKSPDKFLMGIHLRTTGCRLPYGITQCYLPPDTEEEDTRSRRRTFELFSMEYIYRKMSLKNASLLHVLSQPISLFNSPRLDRRLDNDLITSCLLYTSPSPRD